MRVWNRASLARACVLRAPKRTQPARRADGREKEEEVAVVEEGAEKERRLNRRAERKVREAATPVPANINNINNNNNTDRCGVYRAAARGVRFERLSRCVSPRAAVIIGVCAGNCRERGSEPKPPELRQTGEIWALLPYYRPPSILNEGKEVSITLLHVYLHICVFFPFSFDLREVSSWLRPYACVCHVIGTWQRTRVPSLDLGTWPLLLRLSSPRCSFVFTVCFLSIVIIVWSWILQALFWSIKNFLLIFVNRMNINDRI